MRTRHSTGAASFSGLLKVVLLLGGVVLLAWFVWRTTRPTPVPVVLRAAERGLVERTVTNTRAGTVDACRRARLAPPAGGQIIQLKVKEGQRVQAGQLLLELWNKDAEAQLRLAREQAATARARAEQACVAAEVAEREAKRARGLWKDGLIPEEQFDRTTSQAETSRAACQAARAEVEQAEARITAARADLERLELRAPFAGIVAEVTGELGEFATPSPPGIPTPPVIDLIDDSCLYVTAPIDEVDASAVRVGMPARITVDAFAGKTFPGKVRRIAPYVVAVEKQARTVDVEVEFLDAKDTNALLVGYSADVEIILEVHPDVLRIPTPALLEGDRVLVYEPEQGRLEERHLKTGISNWEYTEVLEGVQAGEQVVTSVGREGVRAGVKAVPEKESQAGP